MKILGFQKFLEGWPYEPENNIRFAFAADGREVILVRLPMGLEQFELEDRPDGRRIHGMKSLFDFHLARLNPIPASELDGWHLSAEVCAELLTEAGLYHQRLRLLVRLKDWTRVERDTARNLRLIDFIKTHAQYQEDGEQFDEWGPELSRINAVARAMVLLEQCQYGEALHLARAAMGLKNPPAETAPDCGKLSAALQESLRDGLPHHPELRTQEESLFLRHADYWTIRHRGHTTCLKATRGLHCLAFLLRHAGREFHVSELLASLMDTHAAMPGVTANASEGLVVAGLYDGCPRLDAQAKTEYKQRLNELREELHEAEQFNDGVRAAKAQEEMNAIAEHFAAAIGRGGRDRKTSSEAERARCAVTKRIKQAIQRIAEAIPDLGSHLASSIKTGYFCSYNPHPDRPVAWKF